MKPVHEDRVQHMDPKDAASNQPTVKELLASLELAQQRMSCLSEVSKLLAGFETAEQTVDAALGVVNETLPLRSAVLIKMVCGRSKMIFWPSHGQSSKAGQEAKAHAQRALAYFIGAASSGTTSFTEQEGLTPFSIQESEPESVIGKRYITIPLTLGRHPVFGVLQFESVNPPSKLDLLLVNSIANQLAITLDQARLWRKDVAQREKAEASSRKYEALALENQRLYEQAKLAVGIREHILAIVSHDLRNPLGAILMTASLLSKQKDLVKPDALAQSADRIQRSGTRMLRLIEDLLDFSSIESGSLAIKPEPVTPVSLIDEALVSLEVLAEEKGLRLIAEVEPQLPKAHCDRERILQILSNLVANAITATAEGGHIILRVEMRGRELLFSVSDTGRGLAQEEVEHLFERYWRSESTQYKGSGLGLAIASGLVSAHAGRIWAESELGHGATIFFTLPVAAD